MPSTANLPSSAREVATPFFLCRVLLRRPAQANFSRLAKSAHYIFLDSKINADSDCSYGIKSRLLLGRKAMTTLDSILKSRDIILPTNVHIVKALVFPVIMYRCENWTIKKAEHQRIDGFELQCWRRLLRSYGLQRDQTSQF